MSTEAAVDAAQAARNFWPMFGVGPHMPRVRPKRRRRGKRPEIEGPCPTCKDVIADDSWACCMTCHRVAASKAHIAAAHGLLAHEEDQRFVDQRPRRTPKPPKLTAKERRELEAEYREPDILADQPGELPAEAREWLDRHTADEAAAEDRPCEPSSAAAAPAS